VGENAALLLQGSRELDVCTVVLKLGVCAVALSMLAACGPSSSQYGSVPSAVGNVTPGAQHSTKPTFSLDTELPNGLRPDGSSSTAYSLRATTYVNGKKSLDIANNALGCTVTKQSGLTGCEILAGGSYDISRSTFDLMSKVNGKGCTLLAGRFKGTTNDYPMSIKFKAKNTNSCWK
jgi:hypothetical protein